MAGALLIFFALVKLTSSSKTELTPLPVENSYPEVPRVSLAEAKKAFDRGQATFVDVRSAESFAQSHVAGAISVPELELLSRMAELKSNEWIITYCT
jgi:3-mercaptopyruvate sulfurtransferase SseA